MINLWHTFSFLFLIRTALLQYESCLFTVALPKSPVQYGLDFHHEDSAHNKVILIGGGRAVDFSGPGSDPSLSQDTVSCFQSSKSRFNATTIMCSRRRRVSIRPRCTGNWQCHAASVMQWLKKGRQLIPGLDWCHSIP